MEGCRRDGDTGISTHGSESVEIWNGEEFEEFGEELEKGLF